MGKQKLKTKPSFKVKSKSNSGSKKKLNPLKPKEKKWYPKEKFNKKQISLHGLNGKGDDDLVKQVNKKLSKKFKKKSKKNKVVKQESEMDSDVSVNEEDMMGIDDDNDGSEECDEGNVNDSKFKSEKGKNDKKSRLNEDNSEELNDDGGKPLWDDDNDAEELDDGNSDNYEDEIESHKANLEKLKTIDPEFYKFLQDNDKKLLDFNVSDSEDEKDDEEEAERLHKPTGDLEVASDESDFEGDDDERKEDSRQQVVTLKMLKNWQAALHTDKTNKTIGCLIDAFHAALLRVSNDEDEVSQYKVDGSSVFNAVIQVCVLELSPAIRKFLGLTSSKIPPHKCKKFVKVKLLLRRYFTDLLKLLGGVTSTNILSVLLKHLHHMSPLLVSFPKIAKPLVKKLIHLWGTGEEVVRILSFLCILRITNNQSSSLLDTVLKSMYMTYIINSKFVSVNSLASINFMRRSLSEMFALEPTVSYQHIFLYIRQLAIHLRNAIMVHKKENIQTVYNWQFINSLKLWGNVLQITHDKPQLQPLVYPFVQVCLGTLKLVPTAQYYPLRFHISEILIDFSKNTGIFIPVLPFILEVLTEHDFNKKHKKVSMKPLNFTCLLRVSNSQISENGFKDCLIENVYGLLLEYLAFQSNSIAFPDLSLFCIFQIKQFLKKCNIANYNKKMKQILEKITQSNDFIEKERKNITFKITDYDKIKAWETTVKIKGTPMNTFYDSWNKLKTIKRKKEITDNDKLGDYNLPVLKKFKKDTKKKDDKPANPFPSDSEDEDNFSFGKGNDDDDEEEKPKQKSKNKKKLKKKQTTNKNTNDKSELDDIPDQQDEVKDLDMNDW